MLNKGSISGIDGSRDKKSSMTAPVLHLMLTLLWDAGATSCATDPKSRKLT
jgi:hypothetical protein